MADTRYYVELAKTGILQILDELHALVPGEPVARLSDQRWGDLPTPIDPHHVTTALSELRRFGEVDLTARTTKGGHVVSVHHLSDLRGRTQAFKEASRRKRALYGRFLGWSQTTLRFPRGLVGPAGEEVVHSALHDASPIVGYKLVNPNGGEVHSLLGEDVPDGPLDSAAHLPLLDDSGEIVSGAWILIEVKNVRQWIYRDDYRLYQLLHKAAVLQATHPDRAFVPVLFCRRVQKKTFEMAKAFGFFIGDTKAQYVRAVSETSTERVFELQSELGFTDLVLEDHEPRKKLLRSHLERALPRVAERSAKQWRDVGSKFVDVFDGLRNPHASRGERNAYMRDIYEVVNPTDDDEFAWPDEV